MSQTGKIVEVMFEKVVQTFENQDQMLSLVDFNPMNAQDAQNSSGGSDGSDFPHDYGQGVVWKPVQQHSAIQDGYDLTDKETDIIEETVPCLLGTPKNDFFKQRADSMRDTRFWERRGEQAGMKLATTLNQQIAEACSVQGSLYYETNVANGFDALGIGQAMLNERENLKGDSRWCVLSDRAQLKYSGDLAGRGTLTNRPEDAYADGLIGKNVAGFDVYTGSYTVNQGSATVNEALVSLGAQGKSSTNDSFIPTAGSVNATTGVVTNVDYRVGTLNVAATDGMVVGDKITISSCNSVSLADKTDTGELMTFTVVGVVTDTSIDVYPKPILVNLDDGGSVNEPLYQAYGNCTGALVAGTIVQLNTAGGRSNIFACKNAIAVNGGTLPANLLNEFGGMKVVNATMSNGQAIYMAYDGSINDLTFNCRIFSLWGVTVLDPSACGSFVAT